MFSNHFLSMFFEKSGALILYKFTCMSNEEFKKYGYVDKCDMRHVRRFTTVGNLRIKFFQPFSPELVSI